MIKKDIGRLLENVAELSTLPEVTQRILAVTEDPDSSARDLNEVLKHDMALSSKLLRVVNSAFYGLPGRVADLDRAIVLLGFQAVRNLAVAATMASLFRGEHKDLRGFSAKDLWRHSVSTAVAARSIVNVIGLRSLREEAFLAGIIHDLGIVVEFQYAEPHFARVLAAMENSDLPLVQAEKEILDTTHQSIGQGLAERWKFPRSMQFVTGYHHRPLDLADDLRLLPMVVSLADDMAQKTGFRFLTRGSESPEQDWPVIIQAINLGQQDAEKIQAELPTLVGQASGWLDL